MADVSDVEQALVDQVYTIVYPNGINQPSIVNRDIRIYRGNPIPKNIDNDLANGIININVAAISGMYRPVTEFMRNWETIVSVPLLQATVLNNTITITGSPQSTQNVMTIVNGVGYPYAIQNGDTLDTVASAIAALLPNATAVNNVVTVNDNPWQLIARVGGLENISLEVKRQEQIFGIYVRTTTDNGGYAIRDQLCKALDAQLAYLIWLPLPDGTQANISCKTGLQSDNMQKEKMLMRSLNYCVQYATTITDQQPIITEVSQTLTANFDI